MEEKVTMRLKKNGSNHWLMVRLNLSSDDVRNFKATITLETKTFTEKSKEPDKFGASKIRKNAWKVPKTWSDKLIY